MPPKRTLESLTPDEREAVEGLIELKSSPLPDHGPISTTIAATQSTPMRKRGSHVHGRSVAKPAHLVNAGGRVAFAAPGTKYPTVVDAPEDTDGSGEEFNSTPSRSSSPAPDDPEQKPLTDEEVFALPFAELKNERLLQIARTHKNKDVVAKWNAIHPEALLSDASLSQRLYRAKRYVAKQSDTTAEDVSYDLETDRIKNGVLKQRVKKKEKVGDAESDFTSQPVEALTEEDMSMIDSLDPPTATDPADAAALAALVTEANALLTDPENLINAKMLKVAAVFIPAEILRRAKAADKDTWLNSKRRIADRMRDACKADPTRTEAEVKAELETNRAKFGYQKRLNAYTAMRRKAAHARSKELQELNRMAEEEAKNEVASGDGDETMETDNRAVVGDEEDGWNPLGDLEKACE